MRIKVYTLCYNGEPQYSTLKFSQLKVECNNFFAHCDDPKVLADFDQYLENNCDIIYDIENDKDRAQAWEDFKEIHFENQQWGPYKWFSHPLYIDSE